MVVVMVVIVTMAMVMFSCLSKPWNSVKGRPSF